MATSKERLIAYGYIIAGCSIILVACSLPFIGALLVDLLGPSTVIMGGVAASVCFSGVAGLIFGLFAVGAGISEIERITTAEAKAKTPVLPVCPPKGKTYSGAVYNAALEDAKRITSPNRPDMLSDNPDNETPIFP